MRVCCREPVRCAVSLIKRSCVVAHRHGCRLMVLSIFNFFIIAVNNAIIAVGFRRRRRAPGRIPKTPPKIPNGSFVVNAARFDRSLTFKAGKIHYYYYLSTLFYIGDLYICLPISNGELSVNLTGSKKETRPIVLRSEVICFSFFENHRLASSLQP